MREVPAHDLEITFVPHAVFMDVECFWCPFKISGDDDDWLITISIPGKPTVSTHTDCFEQMAWSMIKFVFQTNEEGSMEPQGLLN